ncbi:SRPBCC family protein [Nocardia heshunensis]
MSLPGQRWGVTAAEVALELPCDGVLSGPVVVCDRAVSVDAPAPTVFEWLCQLRVAPYSYDLLDNFGRRSPRARDPKLTELAVGQRFMSLFDLVEYQPGARITLRSSGVAVTYIAHPESDSHSRLHARVLFKGPTWLLALPVFGDFLMMRKQLLTLKELAEREVLALG